MKIIFNPLHKKLPFKKTVLVIGVFDGVHIGHQKLMAKAIVRGRELGLPVVVMTFDPHPLKVLRPELEVRLLTTIPHRAKLMGELGVDACVVVPFTREFSQLSPSAFIKDYLVDQLKVSEVFVGDDFRFGQQRGAGIDVFQLEAERFGFHVNAVEVLKREKNESKVGSSMVRNFILEGDLKNAERCLGRPVGLMGEVVHGDGRGKTLGFPTANLKTDGLVVPPNGVYAVCVEVEGEKFKGMANVGVRPSFDPPQACQRIEIHLFDFKNDLYGCQIVVQFIKKIRSEKRFSSELDLIDQIKLDRVEIQNILAKNLL